MRPRVMFIGLLAASLFATTALAQPEPSLDLVIAGLQSMHDRLNSPGEDWELVFRHEMWREERPEAVKSPYQTADSARNSAKPDADDKSTRVGWTSTLRRKGDNLLLRRDFEDKTFDVQSWHAGVNASLSGTNIVVSPSFNPAISQTTHFTNYLFVDVSPANSIWAEGVKEIFESRGPSDHFIWALPRTVVEHKDEFQLEQNEDGTLVTLSRSPRDTIVLDPRRNHAVVSRQYNFKDEFPLFIVRNSDFSEVAPGFWLPKVQEASKFFAPPASPEKYGQVSLRERNELVSFQFRELAETDFHLPLPESGHVYDQIRKVSYRKFPETDSAEQALSSALKEARQWESSHGAATGSWAWLFAVNGVLLAAILVGYRHKVVNSLRPPVTSPPKSSQA